MVNYLLPGWGRQNENSLVYLHNGQLRQGWLLKTAALPPR